VCVCVCVFVCVFVRTCVCVFAGHNRRKRAWSVRVRKPLACAAWALLCLSVYRLPASCPSVCLSVWRTTTSQRQQEVLPAACPAGDDFTRKRNVPVLLLPQEPHCIQGWRQPSLERSTTLLEALHSIRDTVHFGVYLLTSLFTTFQCLQ
jgi:hypothetical protein